MSNNAASLMASLTGDGGGSAGGNSGGGDQDLFGDIPIDDPPAPAPAPFPVAQNNSNNNSNSMSNGSGSVYQDPMGNSYTNYPYPQVQQQPQSNAPNITYAAPAPAPPMTQSQPAMPVPVPAPPANNNTNMSKSLLLNTGLLVGGTGSDEKKADGGGGGLFDDIDQEEEEAQKAAAEEERKRQEQAAAAAAEAQRQQEEQQRMQQQQQQQQQQYSLEARMQGMHLNSGQNSYLQQQSQQLNMQQQQQQQQQGMNQQGQQGMMNQQGQPGNNNFANNMQQGQQQNQMMMNQNSNINNMQQQQQNQMGMNQPNMQNNNNNSMMMNSQQQQQQQQQMGMNQSNQMMQPNQNQMQPPGTPQHNQQQQQQPPSQINVPGVMYRQHPGENPMSPQQQPTNSSPGNRYYNPSTPANITAGLHNAQQPSPYGMPQQQQQQQRHRGPMQITKPPEVPTYYGKVTVSDPMLLQSPSGFLGMVSSPPHWSYQFTTQIKGQPPSVWMVRRRFRHVVALEDRLRAEVPGAVLPPRPDKHVSRALEEASTHQSAEFAHQRSAELERYLNALVVHPEVFASQALKMFLGLQDDMGTAWPEVSGNAFTRMSAMGSSAAANLTTNGAGFFGGATAAPASTTPNQSGGVMSGVMGSVASSVGVGELTEAATEDSAELLALSSSESVKMGAILQAVPKLEGAVTLLREQGEVAGAVGMELNRLAKEVLSQGDRELSMPLEIFSNGLLRYGRRTKRLGQEIGQATMTSFQMQYKLCRYEKLAWSDRRNALTKRLKERGKADKQAQMLMMQQHQYGQQGGYGGYGGQPQMNQYNGGTNMNQMMSNATMSDNMAVQAVRQCDEIGERLKREVNRISFSRRMDWAKSVKLIASYMKEAASERVAIWESTRDTFLQTFPDYHNDTAQWTNVAPRPPAQMQQPNMHQSSMQSSMQSPMQPQMQQPQMQSQMNMNMNSSYMGSPSGMGGGLSQSYQQPQQPQAYNNSMMHSAMPAMQQGQQTPMGNTYQQH